MKKILLNISFTLLLFASKTFAQTANVQIIHNCADPAASAVDIYVNGNLALDNFAFRAATQFLSLPAGTLLNIGVAQANSTSVDDTLVNFPVTFTSGANYYVVASGVLNPGNFAANPNTINTAFTLNVFSQAQQNASGPQVCSLQFFHGCTDAPAVDVLARNYGLSLFTNSTYGSFGSGYVDAPITAPVIIDVTPYQQNQNILVTYLADITGLGGQSALAFASGFLNPTANQNGADFGVFVALPDGAVVQLPDTALALLNIIHNCADPAAAAVDIYVNDQLFIDNFAFRTATGFVNVPADVDLNVGIAPGNSLSSADALVTYNLNLENNQSYIAIAKGVLTPLNFAPNPDGNSTGFDLHIIASAETTSGSQNTVKLNVFHGSTDALTVDVKLAGGPVLIDNLQYGASTNYLSVAPATYFLEITPGNDNNTVVAAYTANLSTLAGQAITLFASGFLNPADNQNGEPFGLFACLTNGTVIALPLTGAVTDSAQIQIIHNAADPAAASVDIYVNGSLLLDNFVFRTATPFVTVPAGVTLTVGVAPANSTSANDAIATFDLVLTPNSKNIAIANGVLNPANFASNPDAVSTGFTIWLDTNAQTAATNPAKVDVKVVHGSTDAPTVDVLIQGVSTPIVDNAKYGDITSYLEVDPITYTLVLTPGNDNNTVVKKYAAPLTTAQGGAAVVFASGFLNPAANQSGPAFGLYACLPSGFVLALPDITTVSANMPSNGLVSIFPNPASDFIIINNQDENLINVQLFDIAGKLIMDYGVILSNTYKAFSTSEINNGSYLLRISKGNEITNHKVMVIK